MQRTDDTRMNDEDKALLIPESAAHAKLEKLDRRDKIVRAIELVFLFLALMFNVFVAAQSVKTQQQIQTNQNANVQHSANRTAQLKAYISCVLQIPIPDRNQAVYDKCDVETSKVTAN